MDNWGRDIGGRRCRNLGRKDAFLKKWWMGKKADKSAVMTTWCRGCVLLPDQRKEDHLHRWHSVLRRKLLHPLPELRSRVSHELSGFSRWAQSPAVREVDLGCFFCVFFFPFCPCSQIQYSWIMTILTGSLFASVVSKIHPSQNFFIVSLMSLICNTLLKCCV